MTLIGGFAKSCMQTLAFYSRFRLGQPYARYRYYRQMINVLSLKLAAYWPILDSRKANAIEHSSVLHVLHECASPNELRMPLQGHPNRAARNGRLNMPSKTPLLPPLYSTSNGPV